MKTLAEVEEITGRSQAVLRKHIERGKLRATRGDKNRTMITQEDLDAYIAAEETAVTAEKLVGQDAQSVAREIGNMIGRLPLKVRDAILDGIPSPPKKPGGSASFEREAALVPKNEPLTETDDPHHGFPVGHQHAESPRWKRTSKSTWSLAGARWSWNGIVWEGAGLVEGRVLGDEISPASPFSHLRPLAPGRAGGK